MMMVTGALTAILLALCAKRLTIMMNFGRSYLAVLALAPTIFFSTISATYRGYFQGRRNMTPTAISQVVEQVVNVVFTLSLAAILLRYGLEVSVAGGTFATTIAAVCASSFLVFLYRKEKESRIVRFHNPEAERLPNKEIVKRILAYSLPMTVAAAMQYTGAIVDAWNTKARLITAGFTDVRSDILYSYLSKYQQFIYVPITLIAQLTVTIIPAIAAVAIVKNKEKVEDNINFAFRFCFMISIPSAVGLSVLSSHIYRLLGYGNGSTLLLYGAIAVIPMACTQTFSAILQGLGKLYLVIFFLIAGIIGKILTNYFIISIPSINIMGALIGNLVCYMVPVILDNILLTRGLKIKVNVFKYAVKPFSASLIMGASVYLVYTVFNKILLMTGGYMSNAISTMASIIAGAYIYFYMMVVIKGIGEEDMNALPRRLRKLIPRHLRNRLFN
jgi:stage V sporulation protein B